MKYLLTVIIFFITGTFLKLYATDVSGNISSNTTWDLAGSPYIVTDDVFVDQNITLTINAGVTIKFDSSKALVVNGTIRAVGDASNLIYFEPTISSPSAYSWAGIYLSITSVPYNFSDQSGCFFKYCYFSYAGTFNKYASAVGTYVTVKSENSIGCDYCTFFSSNCGLSGSSGSQISNCNFRENSADANSGSMVKVGQNSIIHNNLFYDNAVSSSSGMMSANKNLKIYNNIFVKNSFVFTQALSFSDSCQFYNNTFVDNFIVQSASYFKLSKSAIYENTFYRNSIESETFLNSSSSISFHNNSIFNNINSNSGIEMEMVASSNIGETSIATDNYWGSNDSAAIALIIKDAANDGSLCSINFVPFNSLPDTTAPVIPPTGVIKEDLLNGKIKVTWRKNIDADLKGYKIYYGTTTGYSFSNVTDAGTDTTIEITWANASDAIGVTAYDNQANGNIDQYDGNESWFTLADLFVSTNYLFVSGIELNIFPNPTPGNISIQLPLILQQSSTQFVFLNIEGKKVFGITSINQPIVTTQISQPGVYFLQVINENQIFGFKKIIVLK